MTTRKKIALLSVALIWLLVTTFGIFTLFSGGGYIGGNRNKTYTISESYIITVPVNETGWLQVYLPLSYGHQKISEIQIEGADHWENKTHDGFQECLFTITGTGIEQQINILYSANLDGNTLTWQWPVKQEYLLPDELIDSDNHLIEKAVDPLIIIGDEYKTAKNIHRFVHRTIKVSSGGVNQKAMTASQVLASGKGVCGDYAHLMTAMLRAAGIPSRAVSGNAMKNLRRASDWSHPGDAHAWVEFYVDGAWHFADPTWGNRTFDNPDKWHLSYGMVVSDIRSQEHQDFEKSITQQGYVGFGGMTAPLHFQAWCTGEGAIILPRTEIVS